MFWQGFLVGVACTLLFGVFSLLVVWCIASVNTHAQGEVIVDDVTDEHWLDEVIGKDARAGVVSLTSAISQAKPIRHRGRRR